MLRGNCDVLVSVTSWFWNGKRWQAAFPGIVEHPPFGWQEFRRILTGPRNTASRLVKSAESEGVDIRVQFTVTGLEQGPALRVSTPDGMLLVKAKRIVLTTGVRETPRAARMVSGNRPMGVLTTGALQSMVYLKSRKPFKRPVIVGTELVSFSALLTCRHAGIRPVAMVEKRSRPTAWRAAAWLPAIQGVRTLMNTEVTCIEGKDRVSGVTLRNDSGREEHISCDGVVFTGKFVSESTLARLGSLEINPVSGIPVVDQFGRCSDPNIFAAGNMLHPADSSGRCWREELRLRTASHGLWRLACRPRGGPPKCSSLHLSSAM